MGCNDTDDGAVRDVDAENLVVSDICPVDPAGVDCILTDAESHLPLACDCGMAYHLVSNGYWKVETRTPQGSVKE